METQNERVKKVRKEKKLTQKEFGEKIGMKSNSISDIENGKNTVTDAVIRLICSVYSVNENWLRTGKGGDSNMFLLPQKNALVTKATQLLGEHDAVFEAFVATYSQLTPSNRKVLLDFGIDFLENLKISKLNETEIVPNDRMPQSEEELLAESVIEPSGKAI